MGKEGGQKERKERKGEGGREKGGGRETTREEGEKGEKGRETTRGRGEREEEQKRGQEKEKR